MLLVYRYIPGYVFFTNDYSVEACLCPVISVAELPCLTYDPSVWDFLCLITDRAIAGQLCFKSCLVLFCSCVISPLSIAITSLGKRRLILVLFVRLLNLR